jgi:hypothetical protein
VRRGGDRKGEGGMEMRDDKKRGKERYKGERRRGGKEGVVEVGSGKVRVGLQCSAVQYSS